ncbi:hypothetical protein ABT033_20055 [Streptomyces pharetrae]|uniref:hypothetical protein n=1 Tax=Streptomyces pharetrae TaxID=291370 RepID=UPI00334523A4
MNGGLNQAIVAHIHDDGEAHSEASLVRAGRTVGFLEEAHAQAQGEPEQAEFKGKELVDRAISYIPVVSDDVQMGFDYVTGKWLEDEQRRIDERETEKNIADYKDRNEQLTALAKEWRRVHGEGDGQAYLRQDLVEKSTMAGIDHARNAAGGERELKGPVKAALLVAAAACLAVVALLWSTSGEEDHEVPQTLCGTRVSPELSGPLLDAEGEVTEENRVDRKKPRASAWCEVLVGDKAVLSMRFAWHPDEIDPLKVAESVQSVSNLLSPRRVDSSPGIVVGDNGAIATAPCRTTEGSYFTLSVLQEEGASAFDGRSVDIEKFMRAYFPATVRTLSCD